MANLLIGEILKDINTDITTLTSKYSGHNYLRNVLEHSYIPEKKFLLPEGLPPFKTQLGPSVQHEQTFWMEAKKFYVYCRTDLKTQKREQMFLNCLESLSQEEAQIFVAVKEQNLETLFPNITLAKLREIGYLK